MFENGKEAEVTSADRCTFISRFSTDESDCRNCKKTTRRGTLYCRNFCSFKKYGITRRNIQTYILNKTVKILFPTMKVNRYGLPKLIVALFAYHGIKFTIDELWLI
ncbi:hypothetical protein CW304_23435 [Bacillus sp. UFRGS-B20]|nr:hypothetical protein CW304_23435 [Bacillus sp. UFRGS-B20]